MWFKQTHKAPQMIKKGEALPGRSTAIFPGEKHAVFGEQLTRYDQQETRPEGVQKIIIGMGCFWGAERLFWRHEGVLNTAVGYCGGFTPNPTYEEVCSGLTGHSEVVQVYFDQRTELSALLKLFWENHDPTQGMRQGNDIGTQYRSVIYWDTPEQRRVVEESAALFQQILNEGGAPLAATQQVTVELGEASTFYYAEPYHQQYLEKNPLGYCGLRGTGATCSL